MGLEEYKIFVFAKQNFNNLTRISLERKLRKNPVDLSLHWMGWKKIVMQNLYDK